MIAIIEVTDLVVKSTPAERCEAYLRPIIERGEGVSRGATVELWAVKP